MRWDHLFEDLEGQLEHELSAEELDVRAEEERLRLGRLTLRDRVFAVHEADPDASLRVVLGDGTTVVVRPVTFGRDWFSADLMDGSSGRRQCVVPIPAVAAVALEPSRVAVSLGGSVEEGARGALSARLSLAFVLRDFCRRRTPLDLRTPLGVAHGTIDRVGRDHLDLAVHEPGEPRRAGAVSHTRLVPLSQVLLVRL